MDNWLLWILEKKTNYFKTNQKIVIMLQKKIIPTLVIVILLFSSCVSSKKLKTANEKIAAQDANISVLTTKNNELQKQVGDLTRQVSDLTATNKSVKDEFSHYKVDCEATKQKYNELVAALTEISNSLDEMEKKLQEAVADFKDKGVEVHVKDGLVYVNMQDNLMYKSGSSALSKEGKKALGSLGAALNEYPKLKVYVVGNTDDKKFKKGSSDNLSLSTERANGVVRTLRDDYKVDPTRLVAAGKGKYAPVADNSTEEGRAKNRRTEIILNPDLVRLWESVRTK